ncbi:cytochrome c-type biogenesis protein CcmE [Blastococcus sp. DSM 46786]|uniref:cytochrome c maturation protein CcmE n=1 Tax=Blastococcus sp. DSM 46786 TaxID=1798227 RepID=UPI0008D461D9|nr:cytochrome c maturation protein CcmE [Blastococcus sp. DSM 46786]SEK68815.1 cytochrome c-type biogenesis protein CcmE [Blastococcus sp. DSM 46786]
MGRVLGLDPAGPGAAVTSTPGPELEERPRGRRRLPLRLLAVAGVVLVGVGILAAAGLQGSLVYYRTPTELLADASLQGDRVRLGGLVVQGSVERTGEGVRFELTDGVTDVAVVNSGQPRGVFQEGQGAVVEGRLGEDGVFRSDVLLVKHDNEYRAPVDGTGRPAEDSG